MKKKRFKKYPIGYFHLDIAEIRTEEGKQHLFVAIDRTSKFTYVEVHDRATRPVAVEFLYQLIKVVPYRIHTILTDNGIQFANQKRHKYAFPLLFDRVCQKNDIDHRQTKPKHPWTNGQVERMIRTLKDATVHCYYYETHEQFKEHLELYILAYNIGRRLKTLKGLAPFEFICRRWLIEPPDRFTVSPYHHTLGLNT